MGLTIAAILTALVSGAFGVYGAVYLWKDMLRPNPDDDGFFIPPTRDLKSLVIGLLAPSLAALSAALSLAAVLTSDGT